MRAAICMLTAVLALAACGVPMQSAPDPIGPGAVPSQLRDGGPTASPQPSTTTCRSALQINFVRNDQLVSIRREAPTGAPAARLHAVIEDLTAGPTETEQANGITTALPPNLNLTITQVQGTRVVLELSGETEGARRPRTSSGSDRSSSRSPRCHPSTRSRSREAESRSRHYSPTAH